MLGAARCCSHHLCAAVTPLAAGLRRALPLPSQQRAACLGRRLHTQQQQQQQQHRQQASGGGGMAAPAAGAAGEGAPAHTNRLATEQSPYLLQHAHNPVNWYPWGEEAFEAARSQGKPIFLSVGYATCHWCHVMEAESFEDAATAALMNRHFVSVKVDREERPDVDRVYMTFVQALSGHGGWPMSVWLTPDLEPFYGGTYYPGKDQYGMPSFTTVLRRIAELWETRRGEVEQQASSLMEQLRELTSSPPSSPTAAGAGAAARRQQLDQQALLALAAGCARQLVKSFDSKLGGFGGPPKFPRPSEINLLLRAATEQAAASAAAAGLGGAPVPQQQQPRSAAAPSAQLLLGASLFTLQAMAAGGMYDQLGGGFHRYSVDEFWHVPHFEKMMYDNPQLASTYLDAFRVALAAQRRPGAAPGTAPGAAAGAAAAPLGAGAAAGGGGLPSVSDGRLADPSAYASVARGVLDYLRRDMTHPEGGLFAAEDADSLDPETGRRAEGSFYVWSAAEVDEALGPERAPLFREVYGVAPEGNCTLSPRSDPHDEFKGKNVLMQFKQPGDTEAAKAAGLTAAEASELLAGCRRDLHARRAARPRPSLDDKVVAAWNGQAISAFAVASRALAAQRPPPPPCFPSDGCEPGEYLRAALAAARFARARLWDAGAGRLRRAYRNAPSAVEGFADDYALMVSGLLDLFEAGGGLEWLRWAAELQDAQDQLFWDAREGGYFQTSGTDPSVKLRLKEEHDGAEPAASSVAAANLIRLAALLPNGGEPQARTRRGEGGSDQQQQQQQQMTYAERGDAVLACFKGRLDQAAIAMPQMCAAAWLRTRAPLRQVIVAGRAGDPATEALLDAAHAAWAPDKAVLPIDPADQEAAAFWEQHNPGAWAMVSAHFAKQQAGAAAPAGPAREQAAEAVASEAVPAAGAGGAAAPTAFVCQNFTCQAPTSSPDRLYELLSAPSRAGGAAPRLTPVAL